MTQLTGVESEDIVVLSGFFSFLFHSLSTSCLLCKTLCSLTSLHSVILFEHFEKPDRPQSTYHNIPAPVRSEDGNLFFFFLCLAGDGSCSLSACLGTEDSEGQDDRKSTRRRHTLLTIIRSISEISDSGFVGVQESNERTVLVTPAHSLTHTHTHNCSAQTNCSQIAV